MILIALKGELKRHLITLKRYPLEIISSFIVLLLAFYLFFLGSSYLSGHSITGRHLRNFVTSYILWTLALMSTGNMSASIADEAQTGTLEQMGLSPLGITLILFIRSIVSIVFNSIMSFGMLFLMLLLTKQPLNMSLSDLMPMGVAVLCGIGVGYLVASLTLVFKRIRQLLGLLQFLLLIIVMVPFNSFEGSWKILSIIVPFAPMVTWLQKMISHGSGLFVLGGWQYWSMLNAGIWLIGGYVVFQRTIKLATRKGVLGHY